MRPRVFPAEDVDLFRVMGLESARFNEAAGIPRGRPAPMPDITPPAPPLQ